MAKIDKLIDPTGVFGGESSALIAELKRQGYKMVTGQDSFLWNAIQNPQGHLIVAPHAHMPDINNEDYLWRHLAGLIKNDPRIRYVECRLNVLAYVLARDIYIMEHEAPAPDPITMQSMHMMSWRRAVMLAGKILALDLGPVS